MTSASARRARSRWTTRCPTARSSRSDEGSPDGSPLVARTGPSPPVIRLEHPGVRMVAVVAGFHREVAERLLGGARERLIASGLRADHFEDFWVPGAFELPLAARTMALTRR